MDHRVAKYQQGEARKHEIMDKIKDVRKTTLEMQIQDNKMFKEYQAMEERARDAALMREQDRIMAAREEERNMVRWLNCRKDSNIFMKMIKIRRRRDTLMSSYQSNQSLMNTL